MPQASTRYHHGNLREACIQAARELLEEGDNSELSLRAVARRAGVSATAPYRHFADREALLSGVAAEGHREIAGDLGAAQPSPSTPADLADIGVAYVRFALDHPALFRVMFAEPCDPSSPERVAATTAINEYLHQVVRQVLPDADTDAMATTLWALVHGMAFLHLDGKLDSSSPEAVATTIHAAMTVMFGRPPAA